jgi:hypothetical protein
MYILDGIVISSFGFKRYKLIYKYHDMCFVFGCWIVHPCLRQCRKYVFTLLLSVYIYSLLSLDFLSNITHCHFPNDLRNGIDSRISLIKQFRTQT